MCMYLVYKEKENCSSTRIPLGTYDIMLSHRLSHTLGHIIHIDVTIGCHIYPIYVTYASHIKHKDVTYGSQKVIQTILDLRNVFVPK
jgi:hypothetical protein